MRTKLKWSRKGRLNLCQILVSNKTPPHTHQIPPKVHYQFSTHSQVAKGRKTFSINSLSHPPPPPPLLPFYYLITLHLSFLRTVDCELVSDTLIDVTATHICKHGCTLMPRLKGVTLSIKLDIIKYFKCGKQNKEIELFFLTYLQPLHLVLFLTRGKEL